ncbi:hypothetical protein ABZ721_28345 [Streptomyces sp. NPDC006733]|uniref:hypothetical protein n=1 Tax=Streptomyces sp. NPDC006733 TaxID=3155460 RepID=UPI0033CD9E0B
MPGGHCAPFLAEHEHVVAAEVSFLRRHLLDAAQADGVDPAAASAPRGPGDRRVTPP